MFFEKSTFITMSNQQSTYGNASPANDINESDARKRRMRSILSQILASTAKNVVLFSCGLLLGFPTIVIPSVHDAPVNSTLILTDEEVSWFGSIGYVVNPIGCIFSGWLSNRIGRRRSMQLLMIPVLAIWIIFYYSNSATMLLSGAVLVGLTAGFLEAPVITYISEISEPYLRGILSVTATFTTLLGAFTQYLLGSVLDWRTLSAACTVSPIITIFALSFVPESPHWLLSKKRFDDTKKALCWLRGWTTNEYIQEEYDQLVSEILPTIKADEDDCDMEDTNRCCSLNLKIFVKRIFIVPFLLVMFTAVVVHFTGITTLRTYAVSIFNSFGSPISGYHATIILGAATVFGPLVSAGFIHYTGKRPLVFFSVTAIGLLTGVAGFYGHFYLGLERLDNGSHVLERFGGVPQYSWLPMLCFILIPFVGYVGIRILHWLLIGEVFPTEIRSMMTGICAGLCYLIGFIANKFFYDLIHLFTLPGVFLFNSAIALASLIVFYFWLPETEGWSLVEVQEHFAGRRDLRKAGVKRESSDLSGHDNLAHIEDGLTS